MNAEFDPDDKALVGPQSVVIIGNLTDKTRMREDPEKFEVKIALRILDPELIHTQITELLGIEPTLAYGKGDIYHPGRTSPPGIRRNGAWMYEEHYPNSPSISDAIDRFLRLFAHQKENMVALSGSVEKMDLFLGVFGTSSQHNLYLPFQTIQNLSSLKLIFDCTFYPTAS